MTQQNVTSEAEPGLRTTVAQTLDQVAEVGLRVLAAILPDFGRFSFSDYVASGFNISGDTLLTFTCRALGVRAAGVRGGVSVSEEPGGGAAVGIRD